MDEWPRGVGPIVLAMDPQARVKHANTPTNGHAASETAETTDKHGGAPRPRDFVRASSESLFP